MSDTIDVLKRVSFLSVLDDETLRELESRATARTFKDGARLVSELEPGADVFVITEGKAEVSVEPRKGEREVLHVLEQGSAFGEMSSLTGELRSATVTARGNVRALVIPDAQFDRLRDRRPEVAVALVSLLAKRIAEAEEAVDILVSAPASLPPAEVKKKKAPRGSLRRIWLELVVNRKRDLPFLTLASFVLTLLAVRLVVYISFTQDFAPKDVLRSAYMSGFALVLSSAAASLLTFRPSFRRFIAIAYGIGGALILNELGVTLAFDIFYKDIHTADPNVPFDVERLYRRAEPLRAIAMGLVVLIQMVYLRRFYARAFFVMKTRVLGLLFKKKTP
jgi:CRP-like cAMP-binding protein